MAVEADRGFARGVDPADRVARVAHARRELLLSVNRRKLPREELEDCYGQATLELVIRSRRAPFASDLHVARALEQKLDSRITDRVRAISGRSPIAALLRGAASLDDDQDDRPLLVTDRAPGVEQQTIARHDLRALREVAGELTDDQRLVLACQVGLGMDCAAFCERYGWSAEKFRKVAQRARARLRSLLVAYDQGERCQQLQPALMAVASQVADPAQAEQVRVHLQTCLGCARTLRDLRAAERGLAALLPAPLAVAKTGVAAKLAALGLAARRLLHLAPGPDGSGGAVAAGGSALGAGAAKLGVTALCVAGAAGGYAVCNRVGVLPTAGAKVAVAHHHRGRVASGSTSPIALATSVGRTTAASSSSARRARPVKRASRVRRTQSEFSAGGAATARTEFSAAASAARATRPAPSPEAPAASREFAAPRHPEAAASEFGG